MQVTIITGASRGIGKAISEDLKGIDGALIELSSARVDFEKYNLVFDSVIPILDCFANISKINLILCAAQIGESNDFSEEQCQKLYAINVLGNLAVINAAKQYQFPMRIVWFAGGGAAFPYPEFFAYSLSKVAVVRAVENLSLVLRDTSIIALAPGAVDTDMLKQVEAAGCKIRTRTDISEPVNFVRKFITDEFDSMAMNGMFIHVRDDLSRLGKENIYRLRRTE
jgi:NAD(P)-dependent dehydrogenase (short-subunit alcohol dehydrogenase family)